MSTLACVRSRLAKEAITHGIRGLSKIPDSLLIYFFKLVLRPSPYPPGQQFYEKLVTQFKKVSTHLSRNCFERAVANFFYNSIIVSIKRRKEFETREGFQPPWLVVISPTMRCNLNCYGCYAGEYTKKDDLNLSLVSRIIDEAKELGIYFFTISGGEPFSWDHLIELFELKNDVVFHVYTNGTLIDEDMAQQLARLGNVIPLISVEGFEEETEKRRGKGSFKKIIRAMDSLKKEGVLFGFSATATRDNNEFIVSDEFIDFYTRKGCFIGWYFNYIPIGRRPNLNLMPTPEQRIYRLNELNKKRFKKDIVLADFWNDGPLVGGCMAAGRYYLHINCRGDVEPCVFAHFAVDNIRNKRLKEVIFSDLFRAIRKQQPFNDNLLRPCMIIDHPHILREVVRETGAYPTHEGADTIINELKENLEDYAYRYGVAANRVWHEEYNSRNSKLPER